MTMAKKKPETQAEAQPAVAVAPAAPPAAAPVAAPAAAAPPVAAAAPAAVAEAHGFRRKLVGKVTSSKMNKTVVVEVVRSALDPVYKKYVRSRARYKAHDETNHYKVGDRVEIQEHRPISRDKRWLVTRLVARPVEE
jgi:small subunit ribosomal protein S17